MTKGYCYAFPGRDAIRGGLSPSFYQKYEAVRKIFREASDYVEEDIADLSFGTAAIEQKWQTVCLVTHSYSIYEIVRQQYGEPEVFAGYSQGEFTACTAAGAFRFPDVLGLISSLEAILAKEKGKEESMYRIVDMSPEKLDEICKQVDETGKNVCVSAYISDSQNIISGKNEFIYQVIDAVKKDGARWAIRIMTDRGYHSPLCGEAARHAKEYFDRAILSKTCLPVYSCYDGQKSINPVCARDRLSRQIDHPIRWNQIVSQLLKEGIHQLIEIGPGCTVSGNTRICNDEMSCRWIGKAEEL